MKCLTLNITQNSDFIIAGFEKCNKNLLSAVFLPVFRPHYLYINRIIQ